MSPQVLLKLVITASLTSEEAHESEAAKDISWICDTLTNDNNAESEKETN